MSYYTVSRNCELSLLKFIEDSVTNDWTGVTVIKSWSERDKVENPVICITLDNTTYTRKELGNTQFRDTYVFIIEVFAKSEAMRIDLTDYIMNTLNPGWTYYTAEKGSGTVRSLNYTSAGRCRIDSIYSNDKVDLGEMCDVKDRYRQNIVLGVTVGVA